MLFVVFSFLAFGAGLNFAAANPGILHFPGGPEATDASSSGGDKLPTGCGIQKTSGTHPWIAKIGYREKGVADISFLCAGVLINKRYVLTAATCLQPANLGRKELSLVHLGDDGLSYPVQCSGKDCIGPKVEVDVENYIIHPEHQSHTDNDIGLIRLKEDVDFSQHYFEPACLATANLNLSSSLTKNSRLQVAGWIIRYGLGFQDELESFDSHLVDKELCHNSFGKSFSGNSNICAKDNCMLSGSPMMFSTHKGRPLTVVGLASFGLSPCKRSGVPAVYISVSHYRNWIMKNLRP